MTNLTFAKSTLLKRILSLIILITLGVGAIGFAPALRPVLAAGASPASILPATTGFYAELDTSNIKGVVNTFADLGTRVGLPVTPDMAFTQLNQGLTMALGRPASFDQDIASWLGDKIGTAIFLPDSVLGLSTMSNSSDQAAIILSVKDDAAAGKFFSDIVASIAKSGSVKFTSGTDTVGGNTITTYTADNVGLTVALWKGFAVLAGKSAYPILIDGLKKSAPTLDQDANFNSTFGLFKPGSLVKVFLGQSLLNLAQQGFQIYRAQNNTPSNTQSTASINTLQQGLFKSIKGLGFALRGQGKVLALDLVESVDQDAEKAATSAFGLPELKLNPTAGKLAERIPASAIAVIDWADLAGLYQYIRTAIPAIAKNVPSGPTEQQTTAAFNLIEGQITSTTGIDLNNDLLSWANGEFAMYFTYDATKATDPNNPPLNWAFLLQATDNAKASTFLDKVNAAYQKLIGSQPGFVPVKQLDTKYYSISNTTGTKFAVSYGVINDVFLVTVGTDPNVAKDAANGTDTISTTTAWKDFIADIPNINQPLLFINMDQLAPLAKPALSSGMSQSSLDQQIAVLNLFESAVIYGSSDGKGGVIASAALILKDPLK